MVCASCGAENPAGHRFCGQCGSALTVGCPACGHASLPGERYCGACGHSLEVTAAVPSAPLAERRLVSVLFADLVGFTSLSESRDPEEVRELLSRYFDTCRRLVELYGGTVEKFIGDAVMAVWGTPVAQEDDAERAVRAALDLIAAVTALGDEVGAPELRARAGVLTGEAAVNVGAVGEGMVAGDLVNTAARIQAAAEPGTVLVGETTRRSTERAIVFADTGTHALKGKTEPVPLWRALRVAAARRGAQRSEGLEAPFVGRERELRLVKELFHASADQSRAQLVQVTGIAGIGKSRLTWEFEKYIDGLAENVWWHRGRCLAYGEGVAYWALAEMVRMRAQIVEGESQDTARTKLALCLEEHLPSEEERAWIGPRLANLLGLEDRVDSDRQDLFAAWRLFFERLTDQGPLIMVFEDLQWADQALLAFVEFLLEWSASQPLYVLALSRPELAQQQPEFGRAIRNAASLALEPLAEEDMSRLLDGYVPGLPDGLKADILARAQGVPLYAVETVRMLLDRGLLAQAGPVYRPTGEIGSLEVPETLHALAAARLDGLPVEERRLVQEACVLGKSFTKQALAALTGAPAGDLDPLLTSLVRKEVLFLQADPRRPERGHYGFLQELLRQVAYETLSRRDRKRRHLAAVAALEATFDGGADEVPEVIASHLLAAVAAAPDDADTPEIRTHARNALTQAGERAAALAAPEEAQRHLDQAASLAGDDSRAQAALLQRAGRLAFQAGDTASARERLERAIVLYEAAGDTAGATLTGVALGDVDLAEDRLDEGVRRLEAALPTLEAAGPTPELAATYASLGRLRSLLGRNEEASPVLEQALRLSEQLALDETLVTALNSKSVVLLLEGRLLEAQLLLEGAVVRSRGRSDANWWRAQNNLAQVMYSVDRLEDALALNSEVVALARQRGDREIIATQLSTSIGILRLLGRWEEALERLATVEALPRVSMIARSELIEAVPILCDRGELGRAEELLATQEWQREAAQPECVVAFAANEARLLRAQGDHEAAQAVAERGLALRPQLTVTSVYMKACTTEALEAAFARGDIDRVRDVLLFVDELHPGQRTPYIEAQRARFHALVDEDETVSFAAARRIFEERGFAFERAVVQLEWAERLARTGSADEGSELLADARALFEQLGARPWLDRAHAAVPA